MLAAAGVAAVGADVADCGVFPKGAIGVSAPSDEGTSTEKTVPKDAGAMSGSSVTAAAAAAAAAAAVAAMADATSLLLIVTSRNVLMKMV